MVGRTSSLILEPEHVQHDLVDRIKKMMKISPWMNDGLVIHIPEYLSHFAHSFNIIKETHARLLYFTHLCLPVAAAVPTLSHHYIFIYLVFWWSAFCVWMTKQMKKHRTNTPHSFKTNHGKQCTREYHSLFQSLIPSNKTMWVHQMNYNVKWPFQLNYTRKINIFSNQTQSNFSIRSI